MARPQVKEGYIRIATELWEALAMAQISGTDFRVLFAISRLTYGYHKKSAKISYGRVAKMCGLDRSNAFRSMHSLKKLGVIYSQDTAPGEARVWGLVKDYEQWGVAIGEPTTSKKPPIGKDTNTPKPTSPKKRPANYDPIWDSF